MMWKRKTNMVSYPQSKWLASAVLLVAIGGCSDGRPVRVPVSGQVVIDGQPVTHGAIRFVPDGARPASGKLGPEGRFTLGTFEDADGAVPGRHRVGVIALEIDGSVQKWHAPKKYSRAETSGLVVEVSEPTDSLVIELTWDGGQGPIIERFTREDGHGYEIR